MLVPRTRNSGAESSKAPINSGRIHRRPCRWISGPGGCRPASGLGTRRCGGGAGRLVAAHERPTERVEVLGDAGDPAGALPELLVTGGAQPARGAVEHVDRPSLSDGPDILKWHPDSEVGRAVVVEVPRRQGKAERVEVLGDAGDPAGALPELLVTGGTDPAGAAVEDVDRPSHLGGPDVLKRGRDGQVGEA